jgi:hypothetical protein
MRTLALLFSMRTVALLLLPIVSALQIGSPRCDSAVRARTPVMASPAAFDGSLVPAGKSSPGMAILFGACFAEFPSAGFVKSAAHRWPSDSRSHA